jgi:HEAT repeat protein
MKRYFSIIVPLSALLVALPFASRAADANATEETQLIGVLRNSQSVQDKAEACARLKWIGTARSVPALAPLLTDGDLSHSARYALESMRNTEAGDALRAAVAKTTGSNEVGIINSLAVRAEPASVPVLLNVLSVSDEDVASSSARGLGRIGGDDAVKALQDAWEKDSGAKVHAAQADALLTAANGLLTKNGGRSAIKIFQELYDHEKDDGLRLAAFRGLILSSEKRGIALMTEAIEKGDPSSQGAALQLASRVGGPATTHALADMLTKLPVPGQIAVLQALQQRNDRAAVPGVREMLASTDADVRMAAIAALGDLGDGTAVLPLALDAATMTGAEKSAARQALVDLRHGGNVTDELVKSLAGHSPEVQVELIRALGERADTVAAPKFLELSQSTNDAVRAAAFEGLSMLAGPPQVPGLIDLIVHASDDDTRSAAADTLTTVCQHIQAQGGKVDAAALAQAAQSVSPAARLALIGVCSGVTDAQIRELLRNSVASQDEAVHAAGIRAMCASQDEELLPDILKIAAAEKPVNFRMLAIRGAVRLIMPEAGGQVTVARKMEILQAVLPSTFNAEGKRLVLSALASMQDTQALKMAEGLLADAEVKVEADDAVVRIARAIGSQHPEQAAAALHQVLDSAPDAGVRKSAQAALKKIKTVE